MAEIVVRVRGRNASIEVSDEEAQKIPNYFLFLSQSPQPVATISNTAKPADIDNESKRIRYLDQTTFLYLLERKWCPLLNHNQIISTEWNQLLNTLHIMRFQALMGKRRRLG